MVCSFPGCIIKREHTHTHKGLLKAETFNPSIVETGSLKSFWRFRGKICCLLSLPNFGNYWQSSKLHGIRTPVSPLSPHSVFLFRHLVLMMFSISPQLSTSCLQMRLQSEVQGWCQLGVGEETVQPSAEKGLWNHSMTKRGIFLQGG